MKYLALALFALLLLAAKDPWPDSNVGTGGGAPGAHSHTGIRAQFGSLSLANTDNTQCLQNGITTNTAACFTTALTPYEIVATTPTVTSFVCLVMDSGTFVDVGDVFSLRPVFYQSGGGTVDGAIMLALAGSTTVDGSGFTSTGSATSPYTGAQSIGLKVDAAAGTWASVNMRCGMHIEATP